MVRLPSEVTDRMIFDWFATHDAPPTCVLPPYGRNGLPSRDRTVFFAKMLPQLFWCRHHPGHFGKFISRRRMMEWLPCLRVSSTTRLHGTTALHHLPYNSVRRLAPFPRLPRHRPLHILPQDHHLGMCSCTSSRLFVRLSPPRLLTRLPR